MHDDRVGGVGMEALSRVDLHPRPDDRNQGVLEECSEGHAHKRRIARRGPWSPSVRFRLRPGREVRRIRSHVTWTLRLHDDDQCRVVAANSSSRGGIGRSGDPGGGEALRIPGPVGLARLSHRAIRDWYDHGSSALDNWGQGLAGSAKDAHAGVVEHDRRLGREPLEAQDQSEEADGCCEKLSHRVMLLEMDYRRLGSTGLKISRLGLGCGNFGGIGSAPAFFGMGESEEQAFALMDGALDAGINFFDTADAYGGGRSETYIGRWLKTKGSAARQQLLLSSKTFNPVGPGPNDRGLSRRHILRQVDESLRRLQTDRIDMYLIHEPDPDTPLEETLTALNDVVRAGKVLYIGASNIEAWRLTRALWISDKHGLTRFDWVQNSYSLLDRAAERDLFSLCADQGIGFTAFSPLAGGWLTGKYRPGGSYPPGSRMTLRPEPYRRLERDETFQGLAAMSDGARARGTEMTSLAIAWALHHPRVDAAIIGPRNREHLDAALAALTIRLSDEEARRLAELFQTPRDEWNEVQ